MPVISARPQRRTTLWRIALLCLGLVMGGVVQGAEAPDLVLSTVFESIGDNERIPDGVVTALAQDGQGFLWIGTASGLVRYDGYRFKRVATRANPEAENESATQISSLLVGIDGRLWIGTQANGVSVLDTRKGTLQQFQHQLDDPDSVPQGAIRALAEASDGSIWLGTTGSGLARIAPNGTVERYSADPAVTGSLPDNRISALRMDRDGTLWIGSWHGLSRLRAGAATFELVLSDPGDPLGFSNTTIRHIFEARNGDLWIGAQQGVMARLPSDLRASRDPIALDAPGLRRWHGNGMNSAVETPDGEVWIAHARGVDVWSQQPMQQIANHRHLQTDRLSLVNADVRALWLDHSGWIWVGTFGGGLQRVDPQNDALLSRRLQPQIDLGLPQFNVLTVAPAHAGGVWLGIAQYGFVRMDSRLQIVERLPTPDHVSDPDMPSVPGEQPSAVAETADGSLWLATDRGFFRRRPGQQTVESLANQAFLEGSSIRRLVPHPDGGLWIGTGDGAFRLLVGSQQIRRVARVDGSPARGSFNAFVQATDGRWWIGSAFGLYLADSAGDALTPLTTRSDQGAIASNVAGLLVDRQGEVWMDASGLYRLRELAGSEAIFDAVSARHGHAGDSFGANLLDDISGRIWTHRYLYAPLEDRMHRLHKADGVQFGTGWFRAYARLDNQRLLFGGSEGLLVIRPSRFMPWRFEPTLVSTELRIDGQVAAVLGDITEIRLQPGQRSFSLEFAALDLSAPEGLIYRYALEGYDEERRVVDASQRTASYANLPPGSYRLRIEGSNRDGQWSPNALDIAVEVEPHWWQHSFAAVLGVAALLAAIVGVIALRTRLLERARLDLESQVQARTAQLRALSDALAERTRQFEQASLTDPLTGLRNRRFLMQEMPREVALQQRRSEAKQRIDRGPSWDMLLFLIDIDHFKSINDAHGHAIGDAVLRQIAERLRKVFRATDHLVRWGGEEFLVIARDMDGQQAAEMAERLRLAFAEQAFALENGPTLRRTCSIGFAPLPWCRLAPDRFDWEQVVDYADTALYLVKQLRRDAWIGWLPTDALTNADADTTPTLCQMVDTGQVEISSNLPESDIRQALQQRSAQPLSEKR